MRRYTFCVGLRAALLRDAYTFGSLLFASLVALTPPAARAAVTDAGEIVRAAGLSGGLCVHLAGERDASLAIEMASTGTYAVQILAADAVGASRLRSAIRESKNGVAPASSKNGNGE